jgi:hypothetical protein
MELIHAAKAVAMISRYEADTLEALSKPETAMLTLHLMM